MLLDKWVRFHFSSFASLLRKWRRVRVPFRFRFTYWSSISSCFLLACILRYCVRSRVCREKKKRSVCILQLFTFSLHNYSLSMLVLLISTIYYILHMCVRVCISLYTNVRDSCVSVLYTYLHTDMFGLLLLLLTYLYTCRRDARNWLRRSIKSGSSSFSNIDLSIHCY